MCCLKYKIIRTHWLLFVIKIERNVKWKNCVTLKNNNIVKNKTEILNDIKRLLKYDNNLHFIGRY